MFKAHFIFFIGLLLQTSFGFSQGSMEPIYLPTDLVEATPLEAFDTKTYSWPSQTMKSESFLGDSFYSALNRYPGIQTQGELSSGSVSVRIRGSGSTTRNLILLDGTPLQSLDGLGTQPLLIPQESLNSIDILKGPASLFYGADSVGGALNLKTKTYNRPSLRMGAESANTYSLLLGAPLFQSKEHFAQASVYTQQSQGDFLYNHPSQGLEHRDNNQKTKQRFSSSGSHKFGKFKFSHQEMYAREWGESPGPVSSFDSRLNFDRKAYLLALNTETQVSSEDYLFLKLSQMSTEANNFQLSVDSEYSVSKSFASLGWNHDFSSAFTLQALTDFTYDRFKNPPYLSSTFSEDRFEHALIAQFQMSPDYKALIGARYFPDQNEFVRNILLSQDLKFYSMYVSYSEGLRIPSFNEKYNNSFGLTPNPNLDVEKSSQLELGIQKPSQKNSSQFWNSIYLKTALFQIDYKNFIEFNESGSPYSYLNSGAVESKGVEFSAGYDFLIYNIFASYSFLETSVKNQNRPVVGTPQHQAYLLTSAMFGPVVFELHNTFWSEYRANSANNSKEPQWLVTDLVLRTEGFSDWFIKAGVSNITNKERVFTRTQSSFYPEPGRQYFLFVERFF